MAFSQSIFGNIQLGSTSFEMWKYGAWSPISKQFPQCLPTPCGRIRDPVGTASSTDCPRCSPKYHEGRHSRFQPWQARINKIQKAHLKTAHINLEANLASPQKRIKKFSRRSQYYTRICTSSVNIAGQFKHPILKTNKSRVTMPGKLLQRS